VSYLKAVTTGVMFAGWFLFLPLRVMGVAWFNAILRVKKSKPKDMVDHVNRTMGLFLMGAILIGVESIPTVCCIAKAVAMRPEEIDYVVAATLSGSIVLSFGWLPFLGVAIRAKPMRWKWFPDWYAGEANN